jgi:S-DNA-T family DNA segregation ATPase FtsK/SpoIIIE
MSARALQTSRASNQSPSRGREVTGIILLALAIFLGTSFVSLVFSTGTWLGPGGATAATAVYSVLGLLGAVIPYVLLRTGARVLAGRPIGLRGTDTFGAVLAVVATSVLLDVLFHRHRLGGNSPGGMLGETLAQLGVAIFFRAGAALLALSALAIGLVLASQVSFRVVGGWISSAGRSAARGMRALGAGSLRVLRVMIPTRDELLGRVQDSERVEGERGADRRKAAAKERDKERDRGRNGEDQEQAAAGAVAPAEGAAPSARRRKRSVLAEDADAIPVEVPDGRSDHTERSDSAPEMSAAAAAADLVEAGDAEIPEEVEDTPTPRPQIIVPEYRKPKPGKEIQKGREDLPTYIKTGEGDYELPALGLLDLVEPREGDADKQAMYETAEKLSRTLGDFGIRGHVSAIRPGPVVTMYEFVPAPGTKVSKIENLSKDLAMNLEAMSVRIVAPIPGKAAVGIEVPNRRRETVYLREVLCDDGFRSIKSKIAIALGKDIEGRPAAVDLAKMPHLLVAGTTGAGKSVSVNAMITSILYNASPEDVRLIMIDPKMLELSVYEGIPHLLLPVVTDPKKANLALRWAVEEMERRYELLAKAGVRDISSYNRKIAKALAEVQGGVLDPAAAGKKADAGSGKRIKVVVTGPDGQDQEIEVDAEEEAEAVAAASLPEQSELLTPPASDEPAPRRLPYIVVVIDEFADLMMVASKEVEAAVMRIAQKARAAGIHLLLATQRPSVDVITGVIKANFPSRIAFQVPSKMDSKVILDQHGAESLLGQGDMLFTDRGLPLRRIHGAFVTEDEIKRVVDHLKAQGKPVYDLEILKPRAEDGEEGEPAEDDDDPEYERALALLGEMRQISVSMIQRRLRIGYNRAARIVERMERDGYVGPADNAKPREVLRAPAF